MITNWVIALSNFTYTLFFIITVIYIIKQFKEYKLYREISVLQDIYDYIIRTKEDRKKIFENENLIREYISKNKSLSDIEEQDLRDSIHEVANTYHYAGFLIKKNLIGKDLKSAFFEEGGETFIRVYNLIYPLIEKERKKPFKNTYKQYMDFLYEEYKKLGKLKKSEEN
ncbi:DUF4760 domain-containing protein [Persephonella sp.]